MQSIIIQLSIVLLAALIGGIAAYRFKQPLVVGYLLAGIVLGNILSHGSIVQSSAISFFAELGVALLLFSLGLEFSIRRISAVYKIAVFGGILQIVITALAGFLILPHLFKTSPAEAIFVSLLVAFSSTAVVAKILAEKGELNFLHGEILLGWLIVQDIAVLPVMALFPLFTGAGVSFKSGVLVTLKPIVVLYLVLVIGRKLVPRLFIRLALLNNRELLVLLSFVFCVLFSLGALELGLSFALGAFLAGVCLAASGVNNEVFSEIKPMRDIFAAVFFVSLGFLVNVSFLYSHIPVIVAVSIIILLIKFVAVSGIMLYAGYHSKISFFVGIGLVQIGEFSFVLAKMGFDRGVLSSDTFQIIIASAVATIILTPFLFNKAGSFYEKIRKTVKSRLPRVYEKVFVKLDSLAIYAPKGNLKELKNHIVIIGYGRVGMFVARACDFAKIPYIVVDINYHAMKRLRNRGVPNIFGDAEDAEILKLANVDKAKVLVVAKPGKRENEHILRIARRINANIKIIMRVSSENEAAHFVIEGVKNVIEPEFSASIDIVEKMLGLLEFEETGARDVMSELRKEHRY